MATRIPPHNMTEVINATLHRIDNPQCSVDELIAHVPVSDFPTGGILCSAPGAQQAYRTGRGIVHVWARADFEPMPNDRWRIVIDGCPTRSTRRGDRAHRGLVKDKKILGISDLRDESDRKGMRLVIELKATPSKRSCSMRSSRDASKQLRDDLTWDRPRATKDLYPYRPDRRLHRAPPRRRQPSLSLRAAQGA